MSIEGAASASSLKQIKAISFDLDDTLWHCAPVITKADNALFEWHQRETSRITDTHTAASLQKFRKHFRLEHPELQGCVTAMRIAGLRQLLSDFGYAETLAESAFKVFYKARSEVDLYDGVHTLLNTLSSTYPLAAITNGNADLQSIGIAGYFEKIYAANLTLAEKPAPDMFNLCVSDLGITAGTLLHVGDNPVTDVYGASAAGVQTVWFNQYNETWPDHLEPPHFEVHRISDVLTLFQS